MHHTAALALVLASLAATTTAQATIVTPPGYAATVGTGSNFFPWAREGASMRFQQVLDTTNFTAQGIGGRMLLTGVRFRPAPGSTTTAWSGGSWPNVRVDLATCPVDYLAPGAFFAGNLNADVITCYQGEVSVIGGSGQGTAVPLPPYVDIEFTNAFVYDPNGGNDLVLDVHLDGTGWNGVSRAAETVTTATGGVPLASRVYSTGLSSLSGTTTIGHALIAEWEWQAADNALLPRFSVSASTGASPLTVTFADDSYSTDPSGVLGWAWDFDSDGVVDSTAQNPTHTFTGCGDFDVTLTVYDATHAPATITKNDAVRTDLVAADFTITSFGNGVYQFTDASTPPATAWDWDLDGDGVTDSVVANPFWNFGLQCSGNVRLIATRNCRTSAPVARTILQAPHTLTAQTTVSTLTGTTGTPYAGNFFDVNVTAPEGILVCGLTTQTYTGVGPYEVEVYVTAGTYVGKDTDASQWRLVSSGSGIMNGGRTTAPSINPVPLRNPFYLPVGNYGVAIYHKGITPLHTAYLSYTGNAAGPWTNADLTIHPATSAGGIARNGLFGGSAFGPVRSWHGTIHYTKVTTTGQGGYGYLSSGCTGTAGAVQSIAMTQPRLGMPLTIKLTHLPFSVGAFWFGGTRYAPPVDAGTIGAPGCPVYASPDLLSLVFGANNEATLSTAIPNDIQLLGVRVWAQGAGFDPALNAFGWSLGDAAGLAIGL